MLNDRIAQRDQKQLFLPEKGGKMVRFGIIGRNFIVDMMKDDH